MTTLHFLVVLFVVTVGLQTGCGDDSEQDNSDFTCSIEDRTGTYLMHSVKLSGDCGPMNDSLVVFDAPMDPECTIIDETWSEDECHLSYTIECILPDISISVTGVSIQQDSAGRRITEIMDIWIYDTPTGDLLCHSLYDIVFTRQ
ncbi:hypothetical protein LCGC14_3114290 [marine sediment metagenome]|uniref:Lipocalin-like domain-containing protein n=1 Tax=marine sediment metagenome TaxID=412755 RepID=A0A0F8W4K7_9ZZZZ